MLASTVRPRVLQSVMQSPGRTRSTAACRMARCRQVGESQNFLKAAFATICEDIKKLGSIRLKPESGEWFGLVEDHCRFVSYKSTEHNKKDIVAGRACFEVGLQPGLLEHIKQDGCVIPFIPALFGRTHKNENAYALMKRMLWQFGTSNKCGLKVSALLGCCPDQSSQQTGEIHRAFENALNLLASDKGDNGPLLKWTYVLKGKRYTAAEISAMRLPHQDWLNIYVAVKLIGLSSKMDYTDPSNLNASSQAVLVNEDELMENIMDDEVDFSSFFT